MADNKQESQEKPVQLYRHGDVYRLVFNEQYMTGDAWSSYISQAVDDVVKNFPKPRVVLDISKVEHMSSAVLGQIIGAKQKIIKSGGQMCLGGVCKEVMEIFTITRLDKTINLQPDLEEAIEEMSEELE